MELKAIFTDFDGTLVDTINANTAAYKETFRLLNLPFNEEKYRAAYGLRLDHMMKEQDVDQSLVEVIRKKKAEIYPNFFDKLKLNEDLVNFIKYSKSQGLKICITSTAAKASILNVLNHFNITDLFDFILSGQDVQEGKPNPEVYLKALEKCKCKPHEAIAFEDSLVGVKSAAAAGINYMIIKM